MRIGCTVHSPSKWLMIQLYNSCLQVLREKKIPPWTEIVLVPKTGKASLYPGLFLFTTPCRMVRPVRNLALGKQELIGTFEQVHVNYDRNDAAIIVRDQLQENTN